MSARNKPSIGLTEWAFKDQRRRARQRGIEFLFTYETWHDWWLAELAQKGPDAKRGRGAWIMCRKGDQGPYAPENVYCGTQQDNFADISPAKRAEMAAKTRAYFAENGCWLDGKTGADHPKSRAIVTPAGGFPSLTAAAAHYGVSRTQIRRWLAGDGHWRE